MRLNEKEVQMFANLSKSDLGVTLAGYIERLTGEICDVRNWTDKDTPESSRQAAKFLTEMKAHLGARSRNLVTDPNQYV